MSKTPPIELEFSRKYDKQHAQQYLRKHHANFARRLSHWRDVEVGRQALKMAGEPDLVLDLPCGAGRFWPMLAEHKTRVIIAADNSAAMLNIAQDAQPEDVVKRVRTLQTSAFAINLDDNAVDSIFCIRLLHHIESSENRLAILREFQRVSRDSVIVSLWVDGNFKAWKRKRLEHSRADRGRSGENRFLIKRDVIENEFRQAGFDIVGYKDFLPGYAMWRTYVLSKNSIS